MGRAPADFEHFTSCEALCDRGPCWRAGRPGLRYHELSQESRLVKRLVELLAERLRRVDCIVFTYLHEDLFERVSSGTWP